MIRLRLAELMAEKGFSENRRVDFADVATGTGIHRTTLSKIAHTRGYNITAANVDRLCRFFACQVADLMVYVPDETVPGQIDQTFKGVRAKSGSAS